MSSKTNAFNAYESILNGGITDSSTSLLVDDAGGMADPCYLTLEPDDPVLREVIRCDSISGTTFASLTRGLAGSASGAQAHASGSVIRSTPVHQELDDIYSDIGDLETADSDHFGGTDTADHPEVTGSVRGFSSAADKTKLDGIATGAVADHGALSGLDPDDDHTQYLNVARHDADDHSGLAATDLPDHAAEHKIGGGDILTNIVEQVRSTTTTGYSIGNRISTTEAIEETLTITIPAGWNTYDLWVWTSFSIFEDRTTSSNDTIHFRIRFDDLVGAQISHSVQGMETQPGEGSENVSWISYATGETDTGVVTIVFTAAAVNNDLDWAWDDGVWVVEAHRVT